MTKVIAVTVALIILAGGGYLIFHKNNNSGGLYGSNTSSSSNNSSSNTPPASNTQKTAAATITYDGSGFSPSSITVKSGDTVAIKNTSSTTLQLQSNPHPVHTDDTDLNVGIVNAGQTVTFTVTKTGTFGYHNHLDPSQGGTITIQ